ncbi:MAG: hypothetical protein ABIJ21_07040 [Nanoarchaeota archaeon]
MFISHLFTGSAVEADVESLEDLLINLKGATKEEAFDALERGYPKKKCEELKKEMIGAIHVAEGYLVEYLESRLIPRVLMTLHPSDYEEMRLFPVLRVDYSCDMCSPTTIRREFERDWYVTEQEVFRDLRKNRGFSDFYEWCAIHHQQREIVSSMSFDAPLHEREYKLYSIRSRVKSGESLMMKLIHRLEDSEGPIWDCFGIKVVTLSPHTEVCKRMRWYDYSLILLKDVFNDIMYNMGNPWREEWNAHVTKKVLNEADPQTGDEKKELLEQVLPSEWLVPYTEKTLFDDDKIIADPDKGYLAEKVFDVCGGARGERRILVPVKLHLTSFDFERRHYQGELLHGEYEKRKSMKAIVDWENYQRGIFKWFVEKRFFDRTPLVG